MVVANSKKRSKAKALGSKMITTSTNEKKVLKQTFKQLKLITSDYGGVWDKDKLLDQLYFIGTFHMFLKPQLRRFCKAKKIIISGTKEEIIKRIWTHGFSFDDINEFIRQDTPSKEKTKKMRLVERIQLKKSTQLYHLCHISKNLYNQANYLVKTVYETKTENGHKKWMKFLDLERELYSSPNYQGLPRQVAQQCLRLVEKNWKAFFRAIKDWKKHPEKYLNKPEPPRYKPKNGENLIVFTNQTARIKFSKKEKNYYLSFHYKANLPPVRVNGNRVQDFQQVRILPRGSYYILEIVYYSNIKDSNIPKDRMVGIDLGVRNTMTVVNNIGLRPFIVRGGPVKSVNQYFNKLLANYQKLNAANGLKRTTMRIHRLRRHRNNKINDLFHKLSRALINYCLAYKIGTIVVGYNEGWKQNCRMGRRNNQNFVNIPFYRLIDQIQYKAELVGIDVVTDNESHTSKCSFLDKESIEHHDAYVGTRGVYQSKKNGGVGKVSHGLFKTATGKIINSDVNGGYNILRKAFPKAISADVIEGLELVPYSVKFSELNKLTNLKSTYKQSRKPSADGIRGRGSRPVRPTHNEKTIFKKVVKIF